jgi:hypothetical protein
MLIGLLTVLSRLAVRHQYRYDEESLPATLLPLYDIAFFPQRTMVSLEICVCCICIYINPQFSLSLIVAQQAYQRLTIRNTNFLFWRMTVAKRSCDRRPRFFDAVRLVLAGRCE